MVLFCTRKTGINPGAINSQSIGTSNIRIGNIKLGQTTNPFQKTKQFVFEIKNSIGK